MIVRRDVDLGCAPWLNELGVGAIYDDVLDDLVPEPPRSAPQTVRFKFVSGF
jgi:hypothetical protein